jgi:type I restriction-modification system DNA methylase subunit
MNNFSQLSNQLTENLKDEEKKKQGIFFTPPDTIKKNLEFLKPHLKKIKTVLEPACGSCEFINAINQKYEHLEITGLELNKQIYDSIIEHNKSDNTTLINCNYLDYNNNSTYDLIIGNPPFYVMKKDDVPENYFIKKGKNKVFEHFDGRANIFILFILKSLELLNNNGILSFILPKNFLNCTYYDKNRKFINENYTILHLEECQDKYLDTQQKTILLIIQNKKSTKKNKKFVHKQGEFTIFGEVDNIKILRTLFMNSKSLFDLGFEVKVGNIVWNQHKAILTHDETKTRLIYNSDLKNENCEPTKFKEKVLDKEAIKKEEEEGNNNNNNNNNNKKKIKIYMNNPKKNYIKKKR